MTPQFLFLVQFILIAVLTTFPTAGLWGNSGMNWRTTFGPYGFCVHGNVSTIPTRCFNPLWVALLPRSMQAEAYEIYNDESYEQKICIRSDFPKQKCKYNNLVGNCYARSEPLPPGKSHYDECIFPPRIYMGVQGCASNQISELDSDGIRVCTECQEKDTLTCEVKGLLSPPLSYQTRCGISIRYKEGMCAPSVLDQSVKIVGNVTSDRAQSTLIAMQQEGNAAFACALIGLIISVLAVYVYPFGYRNIPGRKFFVRATNGIAMEDYWTGIWHSDCNSCQTQFIQTERTLAKFPTNHIVLWACACGTLCLLQIVMIATSATLFDIWVNRDGASRMSAWGARHLEYTEYTQTLQGSRLSASFKSSRKTLNGAVIGCLIPLWVLGSYNLCRLLGQLRISIKLAQRLCHRDAAEDQIAESQQNRNISSFKTAPKNPLQEVIDNIGSAPTPPAVPITMQMWQREKVEGEPEVANVPPDFAGSEIDGTSFCVECGKKLPGVGKFCPHCGSRIA